MTKNVTVVDENNYNYGTTYRKRADGLVKTGRACFIDDNTIMLTCPPEISQAEKERLDKIMNDNNNINNQLTEEQVDKFLYASAEQDNSNTSDSSLNSLMGMFKEKSGMAGGKIKEKIKTMSGSGQSHGDILQSLSGGKSASEKPFIETQIEKIIDNLIENGVFLTDEGFKMIEPLFTYMLSYKNVEVKLAIVDAINEMIKSADMDNESVVVELGPIIDTMHHMMNSI